MTTTCAFDSGFSSGFEICAPVVTPLPGVIPVFPIPRVRRVPLEGWGSFAVIGAGDLSVAPALKGEGEIVAYGSGKMLVDDDHVIFMILGMPPGVIR